MLDQARVHVGIAPIGWTNDDMPELGGHIPFEQCISEMALSGYEGCEVGGKFPRAPEVLLPALALRQLIDKLPQLLVQLQRLSRFTLPSDPTTGRRTAENGNREWPVAVPECYSVGRLGCLFFKEVMDTRVFSSSGASMQRARS